MLVHRLRTPGGGSRARYAGSAGVSMVFHAVVALVLALTIVKDQAPELWRAPHDFAISLVEWQVPTAVPRVRPEVAPPEDDTPLEAPDEETTRPALPKPSIGSGAGISVAPGVFASRSGEVAVVTPRKRAALQENPDGVRAEVRRGVTPLGSRDLVTLRMPAAEPVVHVGDGEVVPVELPEGQLHGDSPDVERGSGFFRAGRGLGAGNAPGGSGYGGGNTSLHGTSNGVYRNLMQRLAKGITAASSREEIDVAFIVDTTQSMEDNIRGVRAYMDDFVDLLTYDGRKPKFALVTFRDAAQGRPKVRGFTSKSGDLRNWLHRTEFAGGGDLAESGLDAVMAAVKELRFRRRAYRRFVFMGDGPFHDRDYDGQSNYTLDEVIAALRANSIAVDSVSLEHLPMQQLAWGTGGRWIPIPGKGYLEHVPLALPVRSNAALGVLSTAAERASDEVYVFADPRHPSDWAELRWRILSPRGERIHGEFVERADFDGSRVTFQPLFDPLWFRGSPGYYTVIYRVTDNRGRSSVLRRIIEYR